MLGCTVPQTLLKLERVALVRFDHRWTPIIKNQFVQNAPEEKSRPEHFLPFLSIGRIFCFCSNLSSIVFCDKTKKKLECDVVHAKLGSLTVPKGSSSVSALLEGAVEPGPVVIAVVFSPQ